MKCLLVAGLCVIGLLACSGEKSVQTTAPNASVTAPAPDPAAAVSPSGASAPGPSRTDLSKLPESFPATLIVPDGLSVEIDWKRKLGDSGFSYQYAIATVALGPELRNHHHQLIIEYDNAETAAIAKRNRERATFPLLFLEEGADGAWARAAKWEKNDSCTLDVVIPKAKMTCHKNSVDCSSAKELAKMCLSLEHTGGVPSERHGPEVALGEDDNPTFHETAHKLATAVMRNDREAFIETWSPKGVVIFGRRVTKKRAPKFLASTKSLRLKLKVDCRPSDAPREQGTDTTSASTSGDEDEDEDETCEWYAGMSPFGKEDDYALYPYQAWGGPIVTFHLAKDKAGNYSLDKIYWEEAEG